MDAFLLGHGVCAKEFLDINFSYWQNIQFSWDCPKFHMFKIVFCQV